MAISGHHPLLIRAHLDHITHLDRAIAMIEDEIAACLDAIPGSWGVDADGAAGPEPGPGAAVLPAAERLAEIPGVTLELARGIIAETGLDMTRFPTAARLVSWAGLAPAARQSGPRNRKPGKGQGDAYLKGYCTQAATGAARTDTFLGERLRRLSRRLGGQGQVRRRKVHPRHHLAPPRQPRSQVRRPGTRLARHPRRPRPQDPSPRPPTPGPRPRRHHHPHRRLTQNPA